MANNVETRMWLLSRDGHRLSDKEVEDFFSQFITMLEIEDGDEPRLFDFGTIIPQPDNIWLGAVGGDAYDNLKVIEELGGLEAVKQALKERKCLPIDRQPCLRKEQIIQFGMVNGLDWNREHWQSKWGAYDCQFDWSARHGGSGYANVAFYTAWSVPEKILRLVRNIALKHGYEIECEFGGEIDDPGVYSYGAFMYWKGKWNEVTEELERVGEPINVHN